MAKKIGEEVNVGDFHLDANHEPFIRVADGGSNCANCLYLRIKDGNKCIHPDFIKFTGSDKLPSDISNYCSDWYSPQVGSISDKNMVQKIIDWLNKDINL